MQMGDTVDGAATRSRLALVAGLIDIGEIITARALTQITAGRGAVTQLLGCTSQNSAGKDRIVRADPVIIGGRGIGRQRADAQAAVSGFLYLGHAEAIDVDQSFGRFDLELHQVEEVRPSGYGGGVFGRGEFMRVGKTIGTLEVEWSHQASPCATSRMAVTILA